MVILFGVIGFVFVASVIASLFYLAETTPEDPTMVSCSLEEETSQYMKQEWILNDSISSFEDIPEHERQKLPVEDRSWLIRKNGSLVYEYDPVVYSELSEENKSQFTESINGKIRYNITEGFLSGDKTDLNMVLYNGSLYDCEVFSD
jgi:hypothetical protein